MAKLQLQQYAPRATRRRDCPGSAPTKQAGRWRGVALSAWVAAASMVGTSLLQAIHLGVVAHATCVEHGESLHVDPPFGSAVQAAQSNAPDSGTVAQLPAADGATTHHHDVCNHASLRQDPFRSVVVAKLQVWAGPAFPATSGGELPVRGRWSLLRDAPKVSPPV